MRKLWRAMVVAVLAGAFVVGAGVAAHSAAPIGADSHDVSTPTASEFHFRLGTLSRVHLAPDRTDYAARTTPGGPLLLFLPATGASPDQYRSFLQTGRDLGYHVLGLDYENLGRTLHGMCGADPRCYTRVQRNRFDGSRPSRVSRTHRNGSIVARLDVALAHLAAVDPRGGWSRYTDRGHVRWSRVVVAGHSQGGSEAAFISHFHRVHGVVMLGAPAISKGRHHAGWLDGPGRTSPDRMWAVMHQRDQLRAAIRPTWQRLGIPGARTPFRTDGSTIPSSANHAIVLTFALGHGVRGHSVVAHDDVFVHDLVPVWRSVLAGAA